MTHLSLLHAGESIVLRVLLLYLVMHTARLCWRVHLGKLRMLLRKLLADMGGSGMVHRLCRLKLLFRLGVVRVPRPIFQRGHYLLLMRLEGLGRLLSALRLHGSARR